MNRLYFGDNLPILRAHVADESVDLIYLDPPFNSNAGYNVLFKSPTGESSPAQMEAFEDTWHWNASAELAFDEVMTSGNSDASEMLRSMRGFLKENDMMAYVVMMAVRLIELRRVLKPTGSLYLHCDPTASHYLKIILDAIFGPTRFLNEIIWKRTSSHSGSKRWGPVHDTILFYGKSDTHTWNRQFEGYDESYLQKFYRHSDGKGRYQIDNLTGAGRRGGDSGRPWRNANPDEKGRHWALPTSLLERLRPAQELAGLSTKQKLDLLDTEGYIAWPRSEGMPRLKRYLEHQQGVAIQDIVVDIGPISSQAGERLGYPTQKPVALLKRIVSASSNPGEVVLDPFCGCGTTVHAAQMLGREWIGIDITHLAVGLIRRRLIDAFPLAKFEVLGVPRDIGGARQLAANDKHQFQLWALSLVAAQPFKGGRKGADGGVDGYLYFKPDGKTVEKAIVSVKGGGNIGVSVIRDRIATVEREGAKVGVFVTLEDPTTRMRVEATAAGFYESPMHGKFERIQILTIEDLFAGARPHLPWIDVSIFRKPKREVVNRQEKLDL
jgi:DNA modification methylase